VDRFGKATNKRGVPIGNKLGPGSYEINQSWIKDNKRRKVV
jgi:hypothetical protein